MLPIFAKAPCCLELFGCCCRRLSQHGVGEVLIPLRHCWRHAFFCVCVGSGSFCHDWASHCSVLFWSLDALFVFGLPPLRPSRLLTRQLCGSGCVCRPEFSIIRLKNNSIYLKPDESFVYREEFRFHDSSRFRKKAGDAKLPFYHSFVPVLMSLAAESCRSRAESVHLLKPYLQWGKG